jgi:hypothetical protein
MIRQLFKLIQKRGFAGACRKIRRRIFIRDEAVLSQIARLGAYDYLQKYRYLLARPLEIPAGENPHPNKIWTCWLQGLENAPPLVQQCLHTMKSHHRDGEVVVLDCTNMAQYIDVPDYITQKWREGIIPGAHYADVIRILLLARYGGVWIDATTFLFDELPGYIRHAGLFAFKCTPAAGVVASNWCIAAKPGNPVIARVAGLLCEYWKKERRLVSYTIFHLFFTMAVNSAEETKALWNAVPYFDDINCKILQQELFDTFSAARLAQIKHASPVQKLSYKFPAAQFEKENTFYNSLFTKNNFIL